MEEEKRTVAERLNARPPFLPSLLRRASTFGQHLATKEQEIVANVDNKRMPDTNNPEVGTCLSGEYVQGFQLPGLLVRRYTSHLFRRSTASMADRRLIVC